GFNPKSVTTALNQWLVGATARAASDVTQAITDYKFNEAANAAYDFVWGTFCDWFVELAKPVLSGEDGADKDETRAAAAWALDEILALLHPFMPFVTEELWTETGKHGPAREALLVLSPWPELELGLFHEAASEIDWLVALISAIRSVRTEMNVPAGAQVPLVVVGASDETRERLDRHAAAIARLARVSGVSHAYSVPPSSAQFVVGEATWALPLEGLIDITAEKARLAKEIGKAEGEIAKIDKKLSNPQFMEKAPDAVVEEQRERLAEAQALRDKLA